MDLIYAKYYSGVNCKSDMDIYYECKEISMSYYRLFGKVDQNGYLHNYKNDDDGIRWPYGTGTYWFKHGRLHRENGPASVYDYDESYYLNGILHTKCEWKRKIRNIKLKRIFNF